MRLVEQHIIKSNHKHYNDLKNLCRLSKNLYNTTLYAIRQYYFETNKYLSYANIDRIFKETNNIDYRSLPIQTSQQTMRAVDSNFKSFFKLLKMKQNGKYNKKINITRYLNIEGYYTLTYTAQQLGKKLQSGIIKLPLSDIEFHTNKTNIKQVRFVPKGSYIVMEVVYDVKEADLKSDNGNYAGIDLGINNLVTAVYSEGHSFIIDGRKLKSINQWYNKRNARLQSIKDKQTYGKQRTNRQKAITRDRNNKVNDYMNKAARKVIDYCITNNIGTLVVGYNETFQRNSNIGTQNNQNFVNIPFGQLRSKLEYLCELNSITFVKQEESYTSKASFWDKDEMPIYNVDNSKENLFSGKRIKRGLYQSKEGITLNADINGALNILRKSKVVSLEALYNRGEVDTPIRIRIA